MITHPRIMTFLETVNTENLHVKRMKEMGCDVFKIVNNIAPRFIQNLIMLKKNSQYSLRNDKTAVAPKAGTSTCGHSCMTGPGSGAAC